MWVCAQFYNSAHAQIASLGSSRAPNAMNSFPGASERYRDSSQSMTTNAPIPRQQMSKTAATATARSKTAATATANEPVLHLHFLLPSSFFDDALGFFFACASSSLTTSRQFRFLLTSGFFAFASSQISSSPRTTALTFVINGIVTKRVLCVPIDAMHIVGWTLLTISQLNAGTLRFCHVFRMSSNTAFCSSSSLLLGILRTAQNGCMLSLSSLLHLNARSSSPSPELAVTTAGALNSGNKT